MPYCSGLIQKFIIYKTRTSIKFYYILNLPNYTYIYTY